MFDKIRLSVDIITKTSSDQIPMCLRENKHKLINILDIYLYTILPEKYQLALGISAY